MPDPAIPAVHVGTRRTGEHYVVVIQRVDFRLTPSPIVHGVVRFTAKKHSPAEAGHILLRTPEFYRELEGGDRMDAAMEANVTAFVADRLRKSGIPVGENDLTAVGTLTASKEPWILYTSIRPSQPIGATLLEQQFSSCGPEGAVTTVDDEDAFARQLGIDVARNADLKLAVREDGIDVLARHSIGQAYGKNIDVVVRVTHGPVHYEDITLTVRSGTDMADAGVHRAWFTKGTRFSGECEYRFAIAAGCPTTDTLRLDVSPELSRLTRSLRRRRFAARNGSSAHDLSHVSGQRRRSAARG